MIVGDFNKDPITFQTIRELKKEEQWVDLGDVANWWGRTPGEHTCHSRENAN